MHVDTINSFLTAGANVSITKNATTGVVTISAGGGSSGVSDNSITIAKIVDGNVTTY